MNDNFVSLKAKMLGFLAAGSAREHVAAAIQAGYQHLDYAQQAALTQEYYAFLTRMSPGDLVAVLDGERVHIGVIAGDPVFTSDQDSRLRRPVTWSPTSVSRRDLAAPLPSLIDQQGMVVDLTSAYELLAQLIGEGPDLEPGHANVERAPVVDAVPALVPATDSLARETFFDRSDLQELIDLLQHRQQIVLYGPPGTGKTYVAQAIAQHLVGIDNPDRVQLVQFHPSYAYEDFFEGFRPVELPSGQAGFAITPGPLRRIAGEAANPDNRGRPFVLIVDELNRANLAKVFGELYFLLEYRTRTVRLQYRPEEAFSLPRNLFIIGTMNTADRSIALVDAAIRRRFPFVELHPTDGMAAHVLCRYVDANHIDDDRAELLTTLNAEIGVQGRDFHVGPSYLMRPEITDDAALRRVWRYDILPLLEEHFAGELDRDAVHRRFGIDRLRQLLALEAPERMPESVTADDRG